MFARYVVADLVRNPRRTLSTMVGVILGVGLFCGVLFFVDGLSASMTQRAVEPLPIDMQRIVTEKAASTLSLTQDFDAAVLGAGDSSRVDLVIQNPGELPANEVTVRSRPGPGLSFAAGSAEIDGMAIDGFEGNPFASGPGQTGYNLGTLDAGETVRFSYAVQASTSVRLDESTIVTSYSSRESVNPVEADRPPPEPLGDLAARIADLPGVAQASALSIADLGSATLAAGAVVASGPAKIFGFDDAYAARDETIDILAGAFREDGAVLSAEAAAALRVSVGDSLSIRLPDGGTAGFEVTGIADLSRSRSLFSSRRGGDLETFVYTRNAVVVSPAVFAEVVFPSYERAIVEGAERLKSPPIREVDVNLERELLAADPATAVVETRRIGEEVMAIAAGQDYLLDNISNTLGVAAADASVAKRLFVFLGLPGGLLAAMLAGYAGNVLADAQRREHATLRVRGASRRHLLRMLALRTALLTAAGAVIGLVAGYTAASVILGRASLERASTTSLVTSALVGTLGGFVATGLALYVTGRRSVDRQIDDDRARLADHAPLWRRARVDLVGTAIVVIGSVVALRSGAFEGAPGSVYFGRSVQLNLRLLVLPIAVWLSGSLLAARFAGAVLARSRPASGARFGSVGPGLYRRSVCRRPWAIANGAIIAALIVSLATSLATFTASYDAAKVNDARYANGADVRITPGPTVSRPYAVADTARFATDGLTAATPVIYGLSNVILRSARTSDPANLAALEPDTYAEVAPLDRTTIDALGPLASENGVILLSAEMADFLVVETGDNVNVLLARATDAQIEVELRVAGRFGRLPGFPEGADAVMAIDEHTTHVPTKMPDFFLAATDGSGGGVLDDAIAGLEAGPAATDSFQIDTRETALDRDQSSLAALNIAGLVDLDSVFALAMAGVTIVIFVFGLLLQRRREYVTLRAEGVEARTIRLLITAEAATVAAWGTAAGLAVGAAMGYFFVAVLRPLFVLDPGYTVPLYALAPTILLMGLATVASSIAASRLVNSLQPTELLRDE